tara:strand:+ start:144 stop:809 length:666 start_codon:yes stop_codon:yes gene_type:complete
MRIDNPEIIGGITLPATASGHFSGSFEGDGSQLTGVAPLGGTNISVVGTTVNLDNDVTLTGTITAATGTFVYQIFESSSTIITSGSNIFGNDQNDIQQITGSVFNSGSLTSTGTLTSTSGSIGDLEVVRLTETSALIYKDNVQTLDSSDAIFNLRPVSFNWKSDNREDIGLVAGEVKEHYPQLVKSDGDGNALGVNYSKLTAVLIKTVQDLSARISSLENS